MGGLVKALPSYQLERHWYATDMATVEHGFHGTESEVIYTPYSPDVGQKIVAVDWSEAGWVEVTWLITLP